MSKGMQKQLFQLKFTSKQMQKASKKCERNERVQKKKLAQAISKGNMDGAKIYAENAIREKNQALTYLRLSSRLDAVSARIDTAIQMRKVSRSMGSLVKNLEQAGRTMNLEKLTVTMDKFEKQFEDLEVQGKFVEGTMNKSTSLSTPQDEVDSLIGQVAEAHGLDVAAQFGATPSAAPIAAPTAESSLADRLAKLKAQG
eukprot:TRINITY_DN9977_c0_g1_i1.p2 TRINITY_DN9977_c0_g1~~TRINITY_DN9977_c0_g1_i1.p2  ORF type:complete len:199 (-),score=49.74 TRINITY_DN9977_c0_g1_i1:40-636(-)